MFEEWNLLILLVFFYNKIFVWRSFFSPEHVSILSIFIIIHKIKRLVSKKEAKFFDFITCSTENLYVTNYNFFCRECVFVFV